VVCVHVSVYVCVFIYFKGAMDYSTVSRVCACACVCVRMYGFSDVKGAMEYRAMDELVDGVNNTYTTRRIYGWRLIPWYACLFVYVCVCV
jgi:hypothetical protein